MVYYGLALSAGSLGGGRYISVVLSGLVELPGLYITYHTVNRCVCVCVCVCVLCNSSFVYKCYNAHRLGRKWTQGGFMILAGVCCGLWALGHSAGYKMYIIMWCVCVCVCVCVEREREREIEIAIHSVGLDEYLTLGLALVGKCAIGSSFCVIYLFSAELFPTEVR